MTTQLELALGSRCYYCGQPADYLCDGIVARVADPDNPARLVWHQDALPGEAQFSTKGDLENAFRTCDRPLCQGCIEENQNLFIDGTDASGRRVGSVESWDYCPQCVREQRHRTGMSQMAPLVPAARADAIQTLRLQPGMDRHYRVGFPGRR